MGIIVDQARVRILARRALSPFDLLRVRRDLIQQLLVREVAQRYRGSYLGLVWAFLTPLLTLVVYTLVFSSIFQVRWGAGAAGTETGEFALLLFAGLIPFNLVAECLSRSPNLIVAAPSYVKKVVFPLEVLPVVTVASAFVQSVPSVIVLILATLEVRHTLPVTFLLVPLAYVPLLLLALGLGWLLAALGVYVRDTAQAVTTVVQVLVFLSPVFYPVSVVPEWLRGALYINPLTSIIGFFRSALLADEPFAWGAWCLAVGAGMIIAEVGYAWFTLSRNGFADVL